nr:capsid protein [Otarine picobirnavirus]
MNEKFNAEATEQVEKSSFDAGRKDGSHRRGGNSGRRNPGSSRRSVTRVPKNDPNWYVINKQMLIDVASIPFSNQIGQNFFKEQPGGLGFGESGTAIPGIMCIEYVPAVGPVLGANSPINVMANAIYNYVRHANSGSKTYDRTDLMCYLIAADSLFSLWADVKRAYGFINNYVLGNRYMPDGVLESLGYNPENLKNHIADLRALLNNIAYAANSLWVPSAFSYYKRHVWMNGNAFSDEKGVKSQTYLYKQAGFMKFSGKTSSKGSEVLFVQRPDIMSVETTQKLFDELLTPLISDEDCMTMGGDLKKAFGSNVYTVSMTGENETVIPAPSDEVLGQIMNVTFIGQDIDYSATKIYQTENYLVPEYKFKNPLFYMEDLGGPILNSYSETVSPEEVMVSTRGMCLANDDDSIVCGSEIFTKAVIYSYTFDGTARIPSFYTVQTNMNVDLTKPTTDSLVARDIMTISALCAFDWHPTVYPMLTWQNAAGTKYVGYPMPVNDWGNARHMTSDELMKMHTNAIMAMWNAREFSLA